jgi:hypothetical protein
LPTRQPLGAVPSLLRQTVACPSSLLEHQVVAPQMGQGFCLEASRQPLFLRGWGACRIGILLGLPRLVCRSRLMGAAKVAAGRLWVCMVLHSWGWIPQLPHAPGCCW